MKVLNYAQFLAHPKTQYYLTQVEHEVFGRYTTVKPVINFTDTPPAQLNGAPAYAADTRRVLSAHGLTSDELDRLEATGAIFQRAPAGLAQGER